MFAMLSPTVARAGCMPGTLACNRFTDILHAIIFPATDLLAVQLLARESVVMQLHDALVHVSHVRPFLHEPT